MNIIKRLFDVVFSFCGLVVLLPIFFVLGVMIKKEDKGPIFYKSTRIGKNGKPFKMFKFRTMVVNADSIGPSSTTTNDIRITSVGRRLRKYKLDELPQLFNVLIGDMSIVGPRPEVKKFTDMFNQEEKAILSVKPGITDWASIRFPDEGRILEGSDDPDKAYMEIIRPEKIRLQLKYVREQSFWNDIKIIFLTLKTILQKNR